MEYADFAYMEESSDNDKVGIVIFGRKGVGKSSVAMGIPTKDEKQYCISMDKMSMRVKRGNLFNDSDKIVVLDGVKYLSHDKSEYQNSCVKTFDYILFLIDEIAKKGDADWIIIDGLEVVLEAVEQKMRKENQLGYRQGISNLGVWKDRKLNIRALYEKMKRTAKRGTIVTTYSEKDKIIVEGSLVREIDVPRYIDVILMETDCVVHAETVSTETGLRFLAEIKTSKIDKWLPTGQIYNVTGRKLHEFIGKHPEKLDKAENMPIHEIRKGGDPALIPTTESDVFG